MTKKIFSVLWFYTLFMVGMGTLMCYDQKIPLGTLAHLKATAQLTGIVTAFMLAAISQLTVAIMIGKGSGIRVVGLVILYVEIAFGASCYFVGGPASWAKVDHACLYTSIAIIGGIATLLIALISRACWRTLFGKTPEQEALHNFEIKQKKEKKAQVAYMKNLNPNDPLHAV